MSYQVAVVDPPWQLVMSTKRCVVDLDVDNPLTYHVQLPEMADDSALWVWTLETYAANWVVDAMLAWGYRVCGSLIWRKQTSHGNRGFGLGSPLRLEHARVVVGHRGKPPLKRRNVRSVLDARMRRDGGRPDEFYQLLRDLYEGPFCEIFPRRSVDGFADIPQPSMLAKVGDLD